uniref:Ata13 protein n=1 Tax=Saccharothrix mutabilis subsp. capreolus TaxID=66854 RepID=Q83W25_STRMP|nr:Ata13 protein [Saccharothrix mutabilis subsp. capreolus]
MTAINLRANPYGQGSLAHIARKTALALAGIGAEVALENLRPHVATGPHVDRETGRALRRLGAVPLRGDRWCHVRIAEPQEEERHLIGRMFDAVPWGRNVWWWPVDSSILGGVATDLLLAHLDAMWTSSEHARRSCLAAGLPEDFVRVVPHGVDVRRFHPGGPRAELPTGARFRFLTVADSRFWHRKGLDRLLAAYHDAFRARDDVCLVMHLRRRADVRVVESHLAALAGRHPDPPPVVLDLEPRLDLAPLYRACDVYLQPSRGEAFGLSILEAMACGVPPVVTGWGGQLDFATGETAWRVDHRLVPAIPVTPDRGVWAEVDLPHLTATLRAAFEDEDARRRKRAAGLAMARRWGWERAARIAVAEARRLFQEGR